MLVTVGALVLVSSCRKQELTARAHQLREPNRSGPRLQK
jgi:hypothetical protein